MKPNRRPLAVLIIALMAAALLAACGGDSGGDEDPQQLLDETFASDAEISSGVLEVGLDAELGAEQGGAVKATISGPFESAGEQEPPMIDLAIDFEADGLAGAEDVQFSGGLAVTEDGAFVNVDGTEFAVDDATFAAFEQAYAQSVAEAEQQSEEDQGAALFSQLGIDPSTWLVDVSNEGTEDVNGTETVKISGSADIAKIVEDLGSLAASAPGEAAGVDPAQFRELRDAVKSASVDVYTGAEDKILRLLELTIELEEPGSEATDTISFSLGFSEVNEPQEITAPENATPLEELIPGGLGSGLEGLGGFGGGGGSGGGGGGGAGLEGLDELEGANQRYIDCVNSATTPEEILDCARLLE